MVARKKFNYKAWAKKASGNPMWPEAVVVVGVTWVDATKGEDMRQAGSILAFTPGVLMRVDENEVVVGHEVFEDRSERDVTTIPAGMVKSIVTFGSTELT